MEEGAHVASGNIGKLFAALNRDKSSLAAQCLQKPQTQRPRAHTRFDDSLAGADIGSKENLAGVFGVNDCRTTRHRQDEVRQ